MKHTLMLCLLLACGSASHAQNYFLSNFNTGDPGTESWSSLGPYTSEYGTSIDRGRINAIWVNPNDQNSILAGADGGGLWKSNDSGEHWRCLTDGAATGTNKIFGMNGITCIAVDPLDTNIIYLAIYNNWQYNKSLGYGLGLIFTTDGGSHWSADTEFAGIVNTEVPGTGAAITVTKIGYAPGTSKLYAIWGNYALYKPNYGSPWQDITYAGWWGYGSPVPGIRCLDLGFSNLSPGNAVVSISAFNNSAALWIYNPGSATWHETDIYPDGTDTLNDWDGAVQISISAQDTVYMAVICHNVSHSQVNRLQKMHLYSSVSLQTLNYNFPTVQAPLGNVSQFAVSPGNSNVIYTANYTEGTADGTFTRSTIDGTDASFPWPEISSSEHVDGRCLYIWKAYHDADSDVVYFGCDGGICKKRMNYTHTESITGAGLAINEFLGMGNTDADENIAVTGAQDNGSWCYIKGRSTPWFGLEGEDGQNAKMMRNGISNALGEGNPPDLIDWTITPSTSTASYDTAPPPDSSQALIRPIHYDQNDVAYVGYNHIWNLTSMGWQRFFNGGDPIDFDATHYYREDAIDFYIDENNNDTAYIVYAGSTIDRYGVTHATTEAGYGKLYYSYLATDPTSPSWTNISPSLVTTQGINTIAVDPNNNRHIWVGFSISYPAYIGGTAPGDMTGRVLYSGDAGASWSDVSRGLPALPVNKLLYRKGSDDEIYAATDGGVYMWNKSDSTWVSFNNGLPPCVVMDLDFNYCAGKLRMVTYGRGMWETALAPIATPKPMLITGVSTLAASPLGNHNIYLQSSIDVQAGAILGIYDDTVHMPAGAIISVEPGGKLVISHAMITNDCDGKFWHGIQARGICGDPQWAVDQGTVIIENGSTIANALVGVANSDETVAWSTDGGIIQCGNSYFVDNQVSASFREYDYFTGEPLHPVLHPNVSYFTNCTFLLDNNYKGNTTGNSFQYMVNMKSVEGITFSGCQFLNRDTVAYRGLGEGIHAVNTGFNVVATCSPPSSPSSMETCMDEIRSRFCGFSKGIDIGGLWQMPLSVTIDRTDFDSVSVGEFVAAFNDVSTTNCNFNVGHGLRLYTVASSPLTSCDQNVGIFNQNSLRFRIEANNFQGFPNHATTDWYNIGTAIANTGDTATNTVYRNSYDSLDASVFSAGVNTSGSMGHIGLQIRCNTFANSVNDIVIAKDGSASPNQGIALAQGLPAGPPAGNTFSNSIHNIVNDCLDINYYYDNSTSATIAAEEPMAVSLTYVVVRPETATKSCPSTLGDATSSPDGVRTISPITALDYSTLTTMKLAWYNNNARLINVVSVYNGLIDFGNTDSLEAIIAGSTDTTGLYKTLKGGSPYISEAALETAADDAALPYYSMMKIMKMNPDDLRDNNFITYMNGDYSFTTADMDTLLLYANNTTSRSVLEDSIALAHDTMDAMTNLIMMALKTPIDTNVSVNDTTGAGICLDTTSVYYGLDSNSIYLGLDSIDAWLKNIGNVWSRYERVGYYSFMGDNTTAASIFTAMGSEIPSISPDRTVYNTYANIEDVLFTAGTDSGKIYTLDSAQIAALDVTGQPGFTYNSASVVGFNISLAGRTGGGAVGPYPESLAIPCAAYMIVTDFPADRHGNGSAPQSPPPIININADYGNKQFSAYPNPTSGIVTFAYNVQDGTNGITIAITNIVGENVATIQTTNNNGSANWDPRTLPAGVYIYQASDVKGIISKGKIVVEK